MIARRDAVFVECPRNTWTRVARGSFFGVSANYGLSSETSSFRWRWQGSSLPFRKQGEVRIDGEDIVRIPPSAFWRLLVNPSEDTVIRVRTFRG